MDLYICTVEEIFLNNPDLIEQNVGKRIVEILSKMHANNKKNGNNDNMNIEIESKEAETQNNLFTLEVLFQCNELFIRNYIDLIRVEHALVDDETAKFRDHLISIYNRAMNDEGIIEVSKKIKEDEYEQL